MNEHSNSENHKKNRVLFIGSFRSSGRNGNVGGQMFACNSLVNSSLKDNVKWILVDTTASTNLKRGFINRLSKALFRLLKTFYYLTFFRVDTVMAFCSNGHSFLEKGYALKFAKIFGKKTIIAPRSGYLLDDITRSDKFKNKVISIFHSCDTIICQGKFWHSFFLNQLNQPEEKLRIIQNWIDTELYDNSKEQINNPISMLFLGWVDKNKGIWDIFSAVKELSNSNFILYVAGNGEEFEKLSSKIEEENLQDKIKLLDWVYNKEKINLLKQADIFLLPSYREGLPNSLLEAMASKCAVISTFVGAIPDLIKNEENGKLISPGDVAGLTHAINDYISSPDKINNHAEKSLKTVNENNSLSLVVKHFEKIFDLT